MKNQSAKHMAAIATPSARHPRGFIFVNKTKFKSQITNMLSPVGSDFFIFTLTLNENCLI